MMIWASNLQQLIQFRMYDDRISYVPADCPLRMNKRIRGGYFETCLSRAAFSATYFSRASHSALWYGVLSYFTTAIALNFLYRSSGMVVVVRTFLCFMSCHYDTPRIYILLRFYDLMQKHKYYEAHRIPCR